MPQCPIAGDANAGDRCIVLVTYVCNFRSLFVTVQHYENDVVMKLTELMCQVAAPCSGAQSEVFCVWQHLLIFIKIAYHLCTVKSLFEIRNRV